MIELYPGLGALPPFNPDLDTGDDDSLPAPAAGLRAAIGRADAVLIFESRVRARDGGRAQEPPRLACRQYRFPGKPVALINTCARGPRPARRRPGGPSGAGWSGCRSSRPRRGASLRELPGVRASSRRGPDRRDLACMEYAGWPASRAIGGGRRLAAASRPLPHEPAHPP